jgi:hypothetical protein
MDFSTVVVADAGDVVEGEVDSVTFSGDATTVVPVSPRANPPIWDEVQFRTATHHLMYNCGFKDPNVFLKKHKEKFVLHVYIFSFLLFFFRV